MSQSIEDGLVERVARAIRKAATGIPETGLYPLESWRDQARAAIEAHSDTITRLKEALENINRRASPRPDRTLGDCADELMWIADEARAALRSSLGGIRDHA